MRASPSRFRAPEVEARRLHGWEYFRLVRPAAAAPPADNLFEGLP